MRRIVVPELMGASPIGYRIIRLVIMVSTGISKISSLGPIPRAGAKKNSKPDEVYYSFSSADEVFLGESYGSTCIPRAQGL